jgi:hypothetical protein
MIIVNRLSSRLLLTGRLRSDALTCTSQQGKAVHLLRRAHSPTLGDDRRYDYGAEDDPKGDDQQDEHLQPAFLST